MIFDAHLHIINPEFPLVANQGFLPEPFTAEDYLKKTQALNIQGGAIVSGSFQAFDQAYLKDALEKLGDNFVGVTQLPVSTTDDEIVELNEHGVRAVRFNLYRGGSETLQNLEVLAKRIYELVGWHIEFYLDAKDLPELKASILNLPKVSIDHLGMNKEGFSQLLRMAELGVHVKATGFMRVNFDVKEALLQIYKANPDALMFGTDLPGTRASRQFNIDDLTLIQTTFSADAAQKILWENAAAFYGITK